MEKLIRGAWMVRGTYCQYDWTFYDNTLFSYTQQKKEFSKRVSIASKSSFKICILVLVSRCFLASPFLIQYNFVCLWLLTHFVFSMRNKNSPTKFLKHIDVLDLCIRKKNLRLPQQPELLQELYGTSNLWAPSKCSCLGRFQHSSKG